MFLFVRTAEQPFNLHTHKPEVYWNCTYSIHWQRYHWTLWYTITHCEDFFISSQTRITEVSKEILSGRKRFWLVLAWEKTKSCWLKTVYIHKYETRHCLLCHWRSSSKGVVWSFYPNDCAAVAFWGDVGLYFSFFTYNFTEHIVTSYQMSIWPQWPK